MGNQASSSSDVYSRPAVSRYQPLMITHPDRWDYARFDENKTNGVLFHWCCRTSKFIFLQNVPSDTELTILCHFVDMTYFTNYDDAKLSQMLSNPDKNSVPAWFWKEYKKSAGCESDGPESCNEKTSQKRKECNSDSAASVKAKRQKVHQGVSLTRAHCFDFTRSEQRFGSYHLMVPDLVRIGHSCDANCMLPPIQPDLNHAAFRVTTIRDVRAGDELTIDFLQFYKTVESDGLSVEAVFGDERSALLQKHGCASCKLQNCPLCSTGEWGHTT